MLSASFKKIMIEDVHMLTYLFGPNVSLSNTSIETASPCSGAVTSSHWKLCISVKHSGYRSISI